MNPPTQSSSESPATTKFLVESIIGPKQQYQLVEHLQANSHYDLFRAYDSFLNRHVSLCVFASESKDAADAQLEALASLSHPNILPLLDGFREEDHPVHVVKDIDPFLLSDLINEDTALDGEQINCLVPQLFDALIAFHENKTLHLGISPANISLYCSNDGRCRYTLLNLSFSKAMDEDGCCEDYDSSILQKQFHHVAPEALAVEKVDARADLFSLGASIYTLFSGQPPFDAESPIHLAESHRSDTPKHLGSIRSDIPAPIADWVMNLLAVDPVERPKNAQAALEKFQEALYEADEWKREQISHSQVA